MFPRKLLLFIAILLGAFASLAQLACYDLFTFKEHAFVNQETDYYCGPAVLASSLKEHGIEISQTELAAIARTTRELGTSPLDMVRALSAFELRVTQVRVRDLVELRRLLKSAATVIALIHFEGEAHWVIVDGATVAGFRLMDPWTAFKKHREVTGEELLSSWRTQFDKTQIENFAIVVSGENQ